MKKFIITLSALTFLLICLFCIPASAERFEKMPVTLTYENDTHFTITKLDIGKPQLLSGENLYKKDVCITLYGYFDGDVKADGKIKLLLYCYDKNGAHIDTKEFTVSGSDVYEYGSYHHFIIPDVTASIEIASKTPGSWSNTLFVCKYRNVWSTDGRATGIPELLLPIYEKVGWIGDVTLYSLDGRIKDVPYPDVTKYKEVGWYDYTTYAIKKFRSSFNANWAAGEYLGAMADTDYWEAALSGTSYSAELYNNRTKAMDALRVKLNSPLAYVSSKVYQSSGSTYVSVTVRNVSYNTIKRFNCSFTCYDVYGNIKRVNRSYQTADTSIATAHTKTFTWKLDDANIQRISIPVITQVVYSDYTYWAR